MAPRTKSDADGTVRLTQVEIPAGPRYATARESAELARTMPDEFLACREMQHRWTPFTATWSDHEKLFHRRFRCDRCLTEKVQKLDQFGHIVQSSLDYAEGYLAKGMGRIVGDAKDSLRLASVLRQIDGSHVHGERSSGAGKTRRKAA